MIYEESRGSCKNPYGGRINPHRIDIAEWILGPECINSGKVSPEQMLAFSVISQAASEYLFFGPGRNGYQDPVLFWEACTFFYRTRSYSPETWCHAPAIQQLVEEPSGKKTMMRLRAPDRTLQLQCFDVHYEVSKMDRVMPMEGFLEKFKMLRRNHVLKQQAQIQDYQKFIRLTATAGQLAFFGNDEVKRREFLEAMVCPASLEQVQSLLMPYVTRDPYSVPQRFHRVGLYKPRERPRRKKAKGQTSFDLNIIKEQECAALNS